MILGKVEVGEWKPIQITRGGVSISHMFFADDCLLFIKAKVSYVRQLSQTFQEFVVASGLWVNLSKSKVIGSKKLTRRKKEKFTAISSI